MSKDNTDAFAADAGSSRPTREELERQLLEYDRPQGGDTDVEATEPATGTDVAVNDAQGDDGDDYSRPLVTVHSEFLGRDIQIVKPTDVALTMFQQDMSSGLLSDEERLGVFGDFCREHVVADDFKDWRFAIRRAAGRAPSNGQVIFYQETEKLMELIVAQTEETDQAAMDEAVNRAERRAALKKKAQGQGNVGPRGGRR